MPVFLSQSDLGRGDLRLFLTNDLGYKVDPFSVKWTIFEDSGRKVSGNRLPAIKACAGEYYVPWGVCAKNGCYEIVWEYQFEPGCPPQQLRESFFVLEPHKFQCCGEPVCTGASPDPQCNTFMMGDLLGRGGLDLFLKDSDGMPLDAYSVTWQIFDSNGCPVNGATDAVQYAVGEYYSNWFVNVLGGAYTVRWTVIESLGSPAEQFKQEFSVISPSADVCIPKGIHGVAPADPNSVCLIPRSSALFSSCGCNTSFKNCSNVCSTFPPVSMPPVVTETCCPFEIPRTVHLNQQTLPIGGAFTNQSSYSIPSRIRCVTFYIRYKRGSVGGRAALRLLWGNGTEETYSTLIDEAFTDIDDENSEQDMYLNSYKSPIPQNDDFIGFQIETGVPGGATNVRVIAAECGVPMTPGIIEITLTAST